jgi:hypothetical protein
VTGRLAAISILVLAALPVAAHTVPPEAIIAELNGSDGRALGVVSAKRDDRTSRLLLIRVDGGWHRLPEATRRLEAERWLERWRHAQPQGIVAVLDAVSGRPVVNYGPGGMVARLTSPDDELAPSRH